MLSDDILGFKNLEARHARFPRAPDASWTHALTTVSLDSSTMAATAEEAADERPSKRPKVDNLKQDGIISFDDINGDCLVQILSCLDTEAMNGATLINSRFREARKDPSLDQTRTGTIVCRPMPWQDLSILDVYDAIVSRGYNTVFKGSRTRLKVIGLESLTKATAMADIKRRNHSPDVKLPGITSLDVSFNHDSSSRNVKNAPMKALSLVLPNLTEIDLSYMQATQSVIQAFCKNCPNLNRVTWKGSRSSLFLSGQDFKDARNLTELFMDDTIFYDGGIPFRFWGEVPTHAISMFSHCRWLERVSIKGISVASFQGTRDAVTDEMIAKFVRRTPTLRWLRSDLSGDYIAILKQERPEVTFISE